MCESGPEGWERVHVLRCLHQEEFVQGEKEEVAMPRMATVEEIEEFTRRCLATLDQQVIPLESEAAKISAIQAVRYVLQGYIRDDNKALAMSILAYGKIENNR